MPKQAKLIKQGILLTDSTFKDITQRLSKGVRESDTLESFLAKHKDYTLNNPLVVNGYKDELTSIILQETNNHRFSRPAQKELTRATIENRVGDLITRVGDDVRENVRNIVLDGYNNGLSQDKIAENISNKVNSIGNTRARAIARTEIARTATASDYAINVERGATHFSVDCRDTCCTICEEDYDFGKKEYTIDQVEMLPPRHPNCRCYARFYKKDSMESPLTKTPPVQSNTKQSVNSDYHIAKDGTIIDNIGVSEKGYSEIQNFHTTYSNSTTEHGCIMDLRTGKVHSKVFHGEKGEVNVPEKDSNGVSYVKTEHCAILHNHPETGYRTFSPDDIRLTFKSDKINHCVAVSGKEVWILETNPKTRYADGRKIASEFNDKQIEIKKKQAEWVEEKTIEIQEKYTGTERRSKIQELLDYTNSHDYMNKLNKEMSDAFLELAEKHSDHLKLKMVKANELVSMQQTYKNLDSSKLKPEPKPDTKDTVINGLNTKQNEYMQKLRAEVEKAENEVDQLVKTGAYRKRKDFAMLKGQTRMGRMTLDRLEKAIKDGKYSEIPEG